MTDPAPSSPRFVWSQRPNEARAGGVVVPALLVLAVGMFAFLLLRSPDGDDPTPEPVAVTASGPTFGDIEEMGSTVDLVAVGTIVSSGSGRALTDPGDPTSGIVTRLYRLDVDEVLVGDETAFVMVEQEASLLDGTPLVVNGAAPIEIGDHGVWFLVGGDGDEFPYLAMVNEQGFVAIGGDGTLVSELLVVAHLGLDDLREEIGTVERSPRGAESSLDPP